MYNRRLLSLLVDAANYALTAPLTGGKLVQGLRPGIISLISATKPTADRQTHSDSLEFNCHLHMVVTDGLVDYADIACPKYQPVKRWDGAVITEIFRWRLLKSLVKKEVISPDVADNMLLWPHSGFHVHATAPFDPSDAGLVKNRLAYAFRPPVALSRIDFDGTTVTLMTSKRVELKLSPLDFLAKITLHIADRYQNIRRYAGFYSPNIQSKVRRARTDKDVVSHTQVEESRPITPKWAAMLAQIFGELPVMCPKCKTIMDLKEFVFDDALILKFFPFIARAPARQRFSGGPPIKTFGDYVSFSDEPVYSKPEQADSVEGDFNQSRPETDVDFNQDMSW